MYAYMSQPKHQLQTFKAWAGKSSDISYYLNSHHVDFHEWANHGIARPVSVVATGSTGIAKSKYDIDTEDTITLTVQWQNFADGSLGAGTAALRPGSGLRSRLTPLACACDGSARATTLTFVWLRRSEFRQVLL